MSTTIHFKRGGTFSYGDLVELPAGTWSAACKLRDVAGAVIEIMDVTLTPPVNPETKHTLLIECPASRTALWPLATLKGDVVFTDTSSPPLVLPTNTFGVKVEKSETL